MMFKMGIYKITNIMNKKCYVGSSININKRKNQHFNDLLEEKHHSIVLQRAYNKYGKENFIFEVLDYVSKPENLIKYEQLWIDFLKPEYNICPNAGSCLGRKLRPETKEKLSKYNKEHPTLFSLKGEQSINFGRKHTEEWKQNASERMIGKNNPFYGKKHSQEFIEWISENNKGKNIGEKNKSSKLNEDIVKDIIIQYKTGILEQKELAEKYNIDTTNISLITCGKTWKHIYKKVMEENNNFNSYNVDIKQRRTMKVREKIAVLNKEKVLEIVQIRKEKKLSYKKISEIYGVSRITIQNIFTGKSWSDIDKGEI